MNLKNAGNWLLIFSLLTGYQIAFSEELRVLAVEYPPFTTLTEEGRGLSFEQLQKTVGQSVKDNLYVPTFVPPARAELLLADNQFCMSFFPPRSHKEDYDFFALGEEPIHLGLIRKRESGVFKWDKLAELAGASVAILRTQGRGERYQKMIQSGLNPVLVETVEQGIHMLAMDRVDMVFGANLTLQIHAESIGLEAEDYQISVSSVSDVLLGFYYRLDCMERIFLSDIK